MKTVSIEQSYGIVAPGIEYNVINEGYDFVTIRCNGKPMTVPKYLIAKAHKYSRKHEDLPTYDDILAMNEY